MLLRRPFPAARRAGLLAAVCAPFLAVAPANAVPAPPVAAVAAADVAPATVPGLRTDTEALPDADPAAGAALTLAGATQTHAAAGVAPFVAIGFSWTGPAGLEASLVLTYADGTVTAPIDLDQDDAHGEDTTTSTRRVSAPAALDRPATAWRVTLPVEARGVQVHLVREDAAHPVTLGAATDVSAATADGIPGPDGIRTRDSWGARPRKPTEPCAPGGKPEGLGCVAKNGVVNAVVHHTVNANDYSEASVPQLLRSIQAFHQDVEEFDDIGYNFVVDRFGNVWEGRAGGADRPVVGGHVKGFNTGSVGVAALGTFDGAVPNDATLEGIARVIAWKFAMRNVDPFGQITLVSNGGDIYDIGEQVTVNTIDGHRSIGATACPGAQLFARLADIRQRVSALLPLFTGETDGLDRFAGKLTISGFALRRDSSAAVTVRLDVNGAVLGQTVANLRRDDIGARFGGLGANHGFTFTVPMALDATGRACVTEVASGTLLGCRDVNPVTPPFGDFGFTTAVAPPRIGLSGWVIDPDSSEPTVVHVYVDGVLTQLWADKPRPDIAGVYPGYGTNRGFSSDIPTTIGAHQVCVFAINVPAGAHVFQGCKEVVVGQVNRVAPIGSLDLVTGGGASVLVAGWAIDRDVTEPINVHVYVDNALTPIVASAARPDVAAAFPGASVRSGFAARVAAAPGAHTVCVFAIDANLVGPHTLLGCRAVTVLAPDATPPVGSLDLVDAGTGKVDVSGWAIDPDTAAPIAVHVYVDGSGTPIVASRVRADLAAAFPAYGGAHAFAASVPATRGTRTVCAYAINNLAAGANTLLGCRAVVVG